MKLHLDTYVGKLAADYIAKLYPNHTLKELHQQPALLRARGVRRNSKSKIKAVLVNQVGDKEILMINLGDLR